MSSFIPDLLTLGRQRDTNSEARATLAALRRGLGKSPGAAGEMYPFVIPRLPPSTGSGWNWGQQCHFIVAALFAWHPESATGGHAWERNFGASVRHLKRELGESDGPERRFVALLNAESENLPDHLRSMVGLLRANDIGVDWGLLLRDISRWNDPDRITQTNWAKSFWAYSSEQPPEGNRDDASDPQSNGETDPSKSQS